LAAGTVETSAAVAVSGTATGASTGRSGDVEHAGPTGADAAAVGQDLAAVFEEDDPVAEEAPTLLGMAGHDMGGVAVRGIRGRTRWVMGAHGRMLRSVYLVLRPRGHGHTI